MKKEPKSRQDAFALTDLPAHAQPRSLGLRAFDLFLYPMVTNFGVMAISFYATYLTNKGGMRAADGKLLFGKVGELLQRRGDWVEKGLMNAGLNAQSAEMGKMVTWSFIDGSLMAPVIKTLEDRREDIGKWIDTHYGNNTIDEEQYRAEPKQSWKSILGGRALTVGIVVPVAAALDKTGFNDKWFNRPGEKLGKFAAKNPSIMKFLGKYEPKEVGRVALFEAFYTSVCTTGLYYASRAIARKGDKPEAQIHAAQLEHAPPLTQEIEKG